MGQGNSREPAPPTELFEEPWRKICGEDFRETARMLKEDLKKHGERRLNIVMIGHTGAGKSTFINGIFSISRGRIVNMLQVKGDDISGVGTYHFIGMESQPDDLFKNVHIFDTMGFTNVREERDDKGIKSRDLRAVCEGRFKHGERFNIGQSYRNPVPGNKPHCVIFVVAADVIESLSPYDSSEITKKLQAMHSFVPHDCARIAVLTKADRVCAETNRNIRNIYKSKKIYKLVTKVEKLLGVQENEVFPVVNFVRDSSVDDIKAVPLLYALKFALDFASDREALVEKSLFDRIWELCWLV